MRKLLFIIVVAAAAACSKADGGGGQGKATDPAAARSGGSEDDRAAIDKFRIEFAQNFSAGDSKRVAGAYAADAVLMENGQPIVVGQPAIREYMQLQFEIALVETVLTSAEVVFIGDGWAFDRGTYKSSVHFKSNVESSDDEGNYLVLLRRQPDGSWKIARDIESSTRPAN